MGTKFGTKQHEGTFQCQQGSTWMVTRQNTAITSGHVKSRYWNVAECWS